MNQEVSGCRVLMLHPGVKGLISGLDSYQFYPDKPKKEKKMGVHKKPRKGR